MRESKDGGVAYHFGGSSRTMNQASVSDRSLLIVGVIGARDFAIQGVLKAKFYINMTLNLI